MPTGEHLRTARHKAIVSASNRRRTQEGYVWANPNFRGSGVKMAALHAWVARRKERTGVCSHCGRKPKPFGRRTTWGTDFANISGEYRRDVSDYIELCVPCHRVFDAQRGD